MALDVEICMHEDTDLSGDPTVTEEQLVEKATALELKGQLALLGKEGAIPFARMNERERNIWRVACPSQVAVEDYREDLIPLRVLAIVELAKSKEYFDTMHVWSAGKADPILVGKKGDGYYLMARWGDALKAFSDVVAEAKKRWMLLAKAQCERQLIEGQERLRSLDSYCAEWAEGRYVPIYVS